MTLKIMIEGCRDPASFRDPGGQVYHVNDRVLRAVLPAAVADFEFVRSTNLISQLVATEKLVPETIIVPTNLPNAIYALEHPRLPFISYPYEWSFAALKAAALLHLDIHLQALEQGVTLADASAFNIQFQGHKPVFIDHLAFCRYQPGAIWMGYRQFCEQFLNPLLLWAYTGVPPHAWFRGNLTGISANVLRSLIPAYRKLFPKVFFHVVLQSSLGKISKTKVKPAKINLPLSALQRLLRSLQVWISDLTPQHCTSGNWKSYTQDYENSPVKAQIVAEFINITKPNLVYDLGCNTGEYAKIALQAGANNIIGFESDTATLELAFEKAANNKLAFLPLYQDLTNPSPSQGWHQTERAGLQTRSRADALLALAVVHHLAIGQNIPLAQIANWLLDLAPEGLVEFVPKSDPRIQEMLQFRQDIFVDYTLENFLHYLSQCAEIVQLKSVSATGRQIIWFRRK